MTISSQKSANCNLSVMVLQSSIRYIWHRKIDTRIRRLDCATAF
jgi:hypothetical protein